MPNRNRTLRKFLTRARLLILPVFIAGMPLIAGWIPPAWANATDNNEAAKIYEENQVTAIDFAKESKTRIKAEAGKATADLLFFQCGGWVYSLYRQYTDTDHNKEVDDYLKSIWSQYAYVWFYWEYQKTHSVYAQFQASYSRRAFGKSFLVDPDDYQGPDVSELYYKLDLGPQFDVPFALTIGRQYLYLGRGIVYSNIHDGVLGEWKLNQWYFKGFISKTLEDEPNVDFSVPAYDKRSERFFYAGQAAVVLNPAVSAYVFGLGQKDWSDPHPPSLIQDYHYDSQYVGSGATAELSKNLEVWSEIIGEEGRGYTDGLRTVVERTKISSWAYLSGAKYRFENPLHPVVETSYSYGSGDGDRLRVTNTEGGDLDGKDHNFLYFGHFMAGYALQPRLSNIRILEFGASCEPFAEVPRLKNVAVGAKQYFYWKDDPGGAMSDFWSTGPSDHVGREVDIFLHWKAADNLLFSVRYGVFHSSKGFADDARDNTQYFSSSCTLTF